MARVTEKLYLTGTNKGYILHKRKDYEKCSNEEKVHVMKSFFKGVIRAKDLPSPAETRHLEVYGEDF